MRQTFVWHRGCLDPAVIQWEVQTWESSEPTTGIEEREAVSHVILEESIGEALSVRWREDADLIILEPRSGTYCSPEDSLMLAAGVAKLTLERTRSLKRW